MAPPRTHYARSGDADLAYQVIGDGPRDIVVAMDWANHLEAIAEQPIFADFISRLGRFARVLWFDMRGVGMSDPVAGGVVLAEAWMEDLEAIMEVTGSEKATLFAQGHATQMAMMAAASHPERVASLILMNGFARLSRADDYPAGMPPRVQEVVLDTIEEQWGTGALAAVLGPSIAERPGVAEWWGRVERYGGSPRVARAKMKAIMELDVRHVLRHVGVPTLVIHNRDDWFVRIDHGRFLAEHIPGALWLERDSADHFPLPDPDVIAAIEEFVTGWRAEAADTDRSLATVFFVDVVGSTEYASELGDRSLRTALDRFEQVVERALSHYEGTLEDTAGDGALATFDGPARAIRCALHVRDELRRSGLEVHSGLHTGEVVRRSEGVAGVAVHIGARVCALAAPGEVLVTRTVRDLVAGSGIVFEERGEHELKGVPDRWALYAALG